MPPMQYPRSISPRLCVSQYNSTLQVKFVFFVAEYFLSTAQSLYHKAFVKNKFKFNYVGFISHFGSGLSRLGNTNFNNHRNSFTFIFRRMYNKLLFSSIHLSGRLFVTLLTSFIGAWLWWLVVGLIHFTTMKAPFQVFCRKYRFTTFYSIYGSTQSVSLTDRTGEGKN